jgi:hypothetical protein
VAYGTRAAPGGPNQQAAVAALGAGASRFAAPVVLTHTGIDGEAVPQASAGPGGVAVAILLGASDPQTIQVTRRESGGTWSAPQLAVTIATAGGSRLPAAAVAVTASDGSTAAAWLLGLDEDPSTGPARLQAFAAMVPPAGGAAASAAFTAADRRLTALALAAAGEEAFAATASPGGPVVLATRAPGGATFAPGALSPDGDGDVLLAAGGAHVLAAFQRGDRVRMAVIR